VTLADHVTRVQARWFVCLPGALTRCAIVSSQPRGARAVPGGDDLRRRDPPPSESGSGFGVEVEALAHPEEDNGWTVLATTVSTEVGTDAEILQAYQEQHTTGDSGVRWIKNLAAISPVWLEQPERMATLAMRTVVGVLVSSLL
jgi:hypothetical protein